jgi:hypothetical protein
VVKSDSGEHCGKAGTGFRQVSLREASVSEPLQKCRKRIRRCQNRDDDTDDGANVLLMDQGNQMEKFAIEWKLKSRIYQAFPVK